ncbi:MAG: orotate phosphoribosyltransferase [Candidatus Paceibacterota bacterium]|jgi:orotate phosphoribosyltransferase
MKNIIDILKEVKALLPDDHFVGTSGGHFDTYINKDMLFLHPGAASEVGKLFAEKYKDKEIDAVVAPALGGIILSQWTAYHLSLLKGKEVLGVYTEKTPEKDQIFTRGYDQFVKGAKVLVVEDLTTTGASVMKVVNAVRQAGGEVVDVCVMVNKDSSVVNSETLGVPFSALAEYPVTVYEADNCELCKKGVPVNTKVGHGKKFVEAQKV